MYGRLHSDICNVPLFLLNGDKIQIKLTKPRNLSTCWVTKLIQKPLSNFPVGHNLFPLTTLCWGSLQRLLFTMVKNTDFLGTTDSNPFKFRHYDWEHIAMYVNGKQIPSEGLSLDMSHEKTTVMGYRTLFEGSVIHHSNTGFQITPPCI